MKASALPSGENLAVLSRKGVLRIAVTLRLRSISMTHTSPPWSLLIIGNAVLVKAM